MIHFCPLFRRKSNNHHSPKYRGVSIRQIENDHHQEAMVSFMGSFVYCGQGGMKVNRKHYWVICPSFLSYLSFPYIYLWSARICLPTKNMFRIFNHLSSVKNTNIPAVCVAIEAICVFDTNIISWLLYNVFLSWCSLYHPHHQTI